MKPRDDTSKTTQATLGRLELRCPPLPQTLVEATRLIDKPEQLEVGPVTEMVQRDPIVVAKLLHIVNSAYYGLRRTINSVERTVVMLGPVAVAGIVVGMNILKLNSILDGPAARCFGQLIRHSLASAFLLRHVLDGPPRQIPGHQKKKSSRVGVSFTAGLLHDFGKIILVYNFPNEALELYEKRTFDKRLREPDIRQLEQLVFGCDHTEAGEFVARKLGFPDSLTDVIRFHHEPERSSGSPETDRLVRTTAAINLVVRAMGYTIGKPLDWETVALDPIWETILKHDLPHYESVAALIVELQQQQEHVDHYVKAMTMSPEQSGKNRRSASRRIPYGL
ncbi:MAG: HDOD domain-containing protein [Rhodothermales bacterium]